MATLLDSIFRFPSDTTLTTERVESILDLLDLPVGVMDKRFRTKYLNTCARRFLGLQGITQGDRSRGSGYQAFRAFLKPFVTESLTDGRAVILPEFTMPVAVQGGFRVVVCPGRIRNSDLAFVIVLTGCREPDEEAAAERIFEGFTVGAILFGPDLRHKILNARALDIFSLKRGETIGRLTSDINPSPQARVLEQQFKHLIMGREGRIEETYPVASTKHGVILSRLVIWPVWNAQGASEGLMILVTPLESQAVADEPDSKTLEMLGREGYLHGPPMFYTHVDGKVAIMNAAGRALIPETAAGSTANLKTDLKWANPQVISTLYESLLGGAQAATAMAELETPSGTRTMRVNARAISDVGSIVSQAYFVLTDATEYENARRLLADTVRSLASEKHILDKVFDALDMPIAVVDESLITIRINAATARRVKIAPEDAVGKPMDQVVTTVWQTGMAGIMKSVIDSGTDAHIERFEHIMKDGNMMPLEIAAYPVRIEGRKCCMVITRELLKRQQIETEAARWESLYRAVVSNIREGVFVVDKDGVILDLNDVVAGPRGGRARAIGTLGADHLKELQEGGVILEARQRAVETGTPQHMGLMKVTRTDTGDEHFVEITHVPLADLGGRAAGVVSLIYFATGVVDLGREVTRHTEDLEKMVGERTAQVSEANRQLSQTVAKITAMARSGLVMAALEEPESVYRSLLSQARETLEADFVSLMLVAKKDGGARTAYYSAGNLPPQGSMDSEAVEAAIAQVSMGREAREVVRIPRPDTLLAEIDLGQSRGLLVAWRGRGEFDKMDAGLAGLLCARMAIAVPNSQYLRELKLRRDKADCLRRIAVRVAGASSVAEAMRSVAEEIAGALPVERLLWIAEAGPGDIWVSEVFSRSGETVPCARRVSTSDGSTAEHIKALAGVRGKSFCDSAAVPGQGDVGTEGDSAARTCPFVGQTGPSPLALRVRELLSDNTGPGDHGSLAVAPVLLSQGSYGLLCAFASDGQALAPDDSCFMCVAASTVAGMWRAADAASAVRRLEAASETVGDIVHDLKYPLNKMRDDLARLGRAGGAAAPHKDAIADLTADIGNLTLLADELAEVANPRSRSPEVLDLAETVDRCLALLADELAPKRIQVRREMGAVPPVFADRKDVTRVLLNVLSNSVEAVATNGSIGISVRVSETEAGQSTVGLVFEDSGPGVPEVRVHRVFDAFFTTKQGGTGLGLFSARKRAQANGGSVTCEIGADGKSRFVVAFPAAVG